MTFKDRFAPISKLPHTGLAFVPLVMGLVGMNPTLVDVARLAIRATHLIRPAQLPDHVKAFGGVNQVLDV